MHLLHVMPTYFWVARIAKERHTKATIAISRPINCPEVFSGQRELSVISSPDDFCWLGWHRRVMPLKKHLWLRVRSSLFIFINSAIQLFSLGICHCIFRRLP